MQKQAPKLVIMAAGMGSRFGGLKQMEPVDREIFLRYYYYLQPAPEIAEAMRLTPGAVRTRLSRGRAALKKRLSQEELLCE